MQERERKVIQRGKESVRTGKKEEYGREGERNERIGKRESGNEREVKEGESITIRESMREEER